MQQLLVIALRVIQTILQNLHYFYGGFLSVAGGEKMDREIKGLDDLKEGDIIRGYVKSCSDVGVFVRLVHMTLFFKLQKYTVL